MSTLLFFNVWGVFFIEKYIDIQISKDVLGSVSDNVNYNKLISKFYFLYEMEQANLNEQGKKIFVKPETLANKRERLDNCNSLWLLDLFEENKVKNFQKTNLCRDKFCHNCKKVKQSQRMSRYIPELEKYQDNLYHLILTVPNVIGEDLAKTIKKMSLSFRKLMYYIRGERVISGFEFLSEIGYLGAVRSLEVTFKGDYYHPHYHVALVADNINLDKKYINDYSYNYGELKNYFSKIEILIQKLWFLIWNDSRITKENINNLELGYSCKLDKFKENEYQELFKYLVKGTDENENSLTYENFKILYKSLHRIKQIQGYGCLYKIDDNIDEELFDELYNEYIEDLYKKENPLKTLESPGELLKDDEYILISKKTYINYLKEIGDL